MIKKAIHSLLHLGKVFLFWILLFDLMRILFLVHNSAKVSEVGWFHISKSFFYAKQLDLSTAAFLTVVPFIVYSLWKIVPKRAFKITTIALFSLLVLAVVFISAGEINTYPEWNHKLSSRVFMHLSNPDEVGRTASGMTIIWFALYSLIGAVFAFVLGKFLFSGFFQAHRTNTWKTKLTAIIGIFIVTPSLFLVARGGFQFIPINIDAAYYSKSNFANDVSINSTYYFGKSFLLYNRSNLDELFPKLDPESARKTTEKLYETNPADFPQILTTKRPNIIVIVLEGWSANAIKSITGRGGVTPYFDQLTKKSLLFSRFYANGGTSDVGNACIFGGFPALPEVSMSMQPEKHRKLPTINNELKKWGYYSGFLFGGDLTYGNIGSFFIDNGFNSVKDERDFPKNLPKGKLNYFDEDLYKLFKKDLNATKEPFLQSVFTGSTHSPYDFPKRKNQNYKGPNEDYMNSLLYADEALHHFMESCKKETWYENTLFVLVADHGHATPAEDDPNQAEFFHIPLLFFGEVLKPEFRGKQNQTIGNQHDIIGTILAQMDGNTSNYPWSKNLLNRGVSNFALHTINRGYGWINENGNYNYNYDLNTILSTTLSQKNKKRAKEQCENFLVHLYQKYKAL